MSQTATIPARKSKRHGTDAAAALNGKHDRLPGLETPPTPGLRLNLGAGEVNIPGFTNVDRKTGQEVYPLAYEDGSVDEILASHVLEHFSHRESGVVLNHWVQKLKPGGKIRLAVPDFELLAKEYLAGKPLNVQGYVMGGHVDADDRHGTIFDRESLTELMMSCGLERIGGWKSETKDCSNLAISLNLQGFKPVSPVREMKNVKAVYSTPRFGPLQHCRCIERATQQLRFESKGGASCFWHQMLSVLMEEAIADESCAFVLTMDFDTIFGAADVLELYRLMQMCPEADAIFPVQSKRGCTDALFSLTDGNGRLKMAISEADLLERHLLPANTGHFGLTMFRAESLRKFKRPWMLPMPNKDGKWDDGQIDADITFWMNFKEQGFQPFLAPKVIVGHLQEIVTWPGRDLKPVYQKPSDYDQFGIPAEVIR
jgi:predicted SAM-dependent methyltransferase